MLCSYYLSDPNASGEERLQTSEERLQLSTFGETCEVTQEEIDDVPGSCGLGSQEKEDEWKKAAVCETKDTDDVLDFDVGFFIEAKGKGLTENEDPEKLYCVMAHTYAYWHDDPCQALHDMTDNQETEIEKGWFIYQGTPEHHDTNEKYITQAYGTSVTYEECDSMS